MADGLPDDIIWPSSQAAEPANLAGLPDDIVWPGQSQVGQAPAAALRPTAPMPPVQDFSEETAPQPSSGLRSATVDVPPPAATQPMPPVTGLETEASPVLPFDDAPFRSVMGGERVPGTEADAGRSGMLTGAKAYESRQASIRGAEQAVAEAEERLAAAKERQRAVGKNLARRGTPGQQQRLYVDAEVARADENLTNAKRALSAAERAAPPTQTPLRSASARAATAVGTMVPDIVGGLARPVDAALDLVGVKGGTGTAEWMRARSKAIEEANPADVTREDEFTDKLGAGIGSAAGFMATGVAGRAAGLTQKITSGVTGAAQNAEQYYRQADDLGQPAYKKALAYITGGAIGSTEAFGIGSTLDRMDRATGGGVRRYFGAVVKEMGEEATQEATQQLLDNLAQYGLFGKDPGDITHDVATNALVGALLGMGMGGVANARTLFSRRGVDAQIPVPEQAPPSGLSAAEQVLSSSPAPPPAAAPPVTAPPAPPPYAPSAAVSPIEQRLLAGAGLTPEQIATMSRPEIDAAIERIGEPTAPVDAAVAPPPVSRETPPAVPTAQLDVQPATTVQGVPLSPSPISETQETTAPPRPKPDLQALLDDPRSADEIKADMAAARDWRPTDDWQAVPQGAAIDPSLEVRTVDGVQQARLAPAPGTREAPVELRTPQDVHTGAEITAIPTPAQAEAGNYQKRHVKMDGLDISVETEQGATRTGVAPDGTPWTVVMPHPYGQILGTRGMDGDPLDITLGPNPQAPNVYVIDQIDPDTGKPDEHKSFQGFNSEAEARAAYEASFSDGSGYLRLGAVSALPRAGFKAWAQSGNTKKPLKYQEPAPVAAAEKAPRKTGPLSLLEFLTARGGLAPDPELRAIFGNTNPLIPGRGKLIRVKGGQPLDAARARAVEAGYLRDTPYEGGVSVSTVRDLLDAIDAEHNTGNKLYSEHDLAEVAEREAAKAAKQETVRRKELVRELRALASTINVAHLLSDEMYDDAANLVQRQGYALDEALVDVAEQFVLYTHEEVVASEQEQTHGEDNAATARGTGEGSDEARQLATGTDDRLEDESPQGRDDRTGAEQAPQPPEAARPAAPAQGVDGYPDIPDFLRRDKKNSPASEAVGASSETPAPTSTESADVTEKVRTPESEIRAEADRRWREWVPSREHPTRPRLASFVKIVRKERRLADREAARARAKEEKAAAKKAEREAEKPDGLANPDQQISASESAPVDWADAKPGDKLANGTVMLRRKINRKSEAEALANSTEGGLLLLDGPKHWAVVTRPSMKGTGLTGAGKPIVQAEEIAPSNEPAKKSPDLALARALLSRIEAGKPVTAKILQEEGEKTHGGKLSEGKFDRRDMADALELAINLYVKDSRHLRVDSPNPRHAIKMLTDLLDEMPGQRVRSDEQVLFQQFSTPPNYAAAVAYVANINKNDTVLEPSAGTGSIVAASSVPGAKIIANELSERRAALLKDLIGENGEVFREDAEQIDNILPDRVKPTVVVMNPPFSQTAGRMGDKKDQAVAQRHIEQALNRLEDGGRLVAIVGQGMTLGSPTHRAFWDRIGKTHAIRASIGVDGKVYEKYGTTFGTRVYVIDKVAPDGSKPVTDNVTSVDALMNALEPIRNGRPEIEQRGAERGGAELAEGSQGERTGALSAPPDAGSVGTGERGGGRVAGEGSARTGRAGEHPARVEAGQRDVLADEQSERPGSGRAGERLAGGPARSGQRGGSGGQSARTDLQPASSGQSSPAASSERVEIVVDAAPPGKQTKSELTESLYEQYEPRRARVKGAKPHPGALVESASMASVLPPPATYNPHLPKGIVEDGLLSTAQLEPLIYAGQAHEKMLPAAEDETPKRRGFFIGDGTGVGKGREIAGIILDNWSQGRTKAIWVSEKQTLLQDAKRDWSGLKQDGNLIFNVGKVKTGEPIESGRGIAFVTYDTLKGGMSDQAAIAKGGFIRKQDVTVNGAAGKVQRVIPGKRNQAAQVVVKLSDGSTVQVSAGEVEAVGELNVKSRVDQLVDWFGVNFDGVIAFDEAHNMGNAANTKGKRGVKEAAQKALAGLELQRRLPNARVVYVSATGATEVSNLAYADRLGLWGRGTPFSSREKFISEVDSGGIAAMELIARDMKSLGLYTARNLSYDGVEYSRIEHKLDANQREIYDTLAEAWQVVLRNINKALEITGSKKDSKAKSAAMSAFWGGHQRFFNQIVTSLQMPSVIKAVEADIKAGRQAVLQLTNTNEASQERAAAKAETAEDIEDLDITPRDQIIQLVETSFPTQQYEEYVDENGKEGSRPVTDSAGNPVENKQAVRMRDELIDRLASIRVPQGPLDMILDHFGVENVAEVTGRGRRFVLKPDEKTGERRRVEESRPGSSNLGETDAFQAGKKKILVFSEAGGTGRSYHADNTAASKDNRRAHYLVQGGWRADKAVQGFGRTHRTNQKSAPIFTLVTTDLNGQKRFISSIARRLSQLGALTKGQRQAGDQGIFTARDNLESTEASYALRQFFTDLYRGQIEGVSLREFEEQTGLSLSQKDAEGRSQGMRQDLPEITTFLNRLLSLKIDLQNAVFDAFSERLDTVIEARAQAGQLDAGLETVKADRITKEEDRVVHAVEESGAETRYVKVKLADEFKPIAFKDVASSKSRPVKMWVKSERGKVYGAMEASSLTDGSGRIVDQFRIINPVSGARIIAQQNIIGYNSKWTTIDAKEAQDFWQKEIDGAPEYVGRDMHLITGAILPIWDRLSGSTRVVRLQTDEGERLLGRVVPKSALAQTLKNLGAEGETSTVTPANLHKELIGGGRARLANGWTLSRRLVAGEQRIELKGPSSFSEAAEVERDGVFSERINYEKRYFIPADEEAGTRVLERLTQYRPVVEMGESQRPAELDGSEDLSIASPAPGFYSAVERAIKNVKLTKAPPAQWLSTIKNLPGVKQEEMEWLGLDDWLKEQKGAVTREALLDYVRANQIEVKEVEKGGRNVHEDGSSSEFEIEEMDDGTFDVFLRDQDEPIIEGMESFAEADEAANEWLRRTPVTKYASYTLPGGENYRELLLTLPGRPQFDDVKPSQAAQDRHRAEWDRLSAEINRERDRTDGPRNNDRKFELEDERDILHNRMVRETIAEMPAHMRDRSDYRTSHWDEPNILAHVRFNDRTIDGKKTLFIEEVQSDWHQEGKRRGYARTFKPSDLTFDRTETDDIPRIEGTEPQKKYWFKVRGYDETPGWGTSEAEARRSALDWLNSPLKKSVGIPNAPFKTTWPDLAFKRMIRYAAEHGYDQIAWTPGEVQADRYDLSKHVRQISYHPVGKDLYRLEITDHHGESVGAGRGIDVTKMTLPQIEETVGKDIAEKIAKGEGEPQKGSTSKVLSGLDLKVGGEGMRGFYDKILTATVNRLVKKFGGKVEHGNLGVPSAMRELVEVRERGDHFDVVDTETGILDQRYYSREAAEAHAREVNENAGYDRPVHTLPITPAMKEAAMGEGFPLFKKGEDSEFTGKADTADQIAKVLRDELDRIGLHDVALKVEETIRRTIRGREITAHGSYLNGVIRIALDSNKKFGTLHHEALHALRKMDLFTDGEWSILERQAAKWREEFGIDRRYAHATETQRDEEAVAHAYEAWQEGKSKPADGRIVRLFKRIQSFFEALRNGLRGHGFKTAEGIFRDIDKGKIGKRPTQGHFLVPSAKEAFSASEEVGADGKPQLVIPGAERMSEREILRRKTLESKRGKAKQKGTEDLPLFSDEKDQGEMFSLPARSEAEKAVLARIVPGEDRRGWWRRQSFSSIYAAVKDDLEPLRKMVAELADGEKLGAKADPYKLARLTRGDAGRAEHFITHATYDFNTLQDNGKSLKEVLRPVKNDIAGLEAYAVAKRTLELNERNIRTGVPIEEARQVVADGNAKYGDVFDDLVAYQRRLTEYLHAAGILSDDGYAAMLTANKDYVPFFRMMGDESELGRNLAGRGLKTRNPVKGIRGSERQIISPIESIIKNTFLFISLAERNRVWTTLEELAETSARGEEVFGKPKPSVRPIEVTEREIGKFLTEQGIDPEAAGAMTIFRPNTFRPNANNEIAFFKDGKRVIRTVDPELAQVANALDRQTLNIVTRILQAPAKTLRAGAVLAPEFIARNPFRDQVDAFLFSKNGYIPFLNMMMGLGSIMRSHGEGYKDFLKSGAAGSALTSLDRNYINEKILQIDKPSVARRLKKLSPLEALRVLTETMENSTRVGDVMRARKKGRDLWEAGFNAREVTLDFSRMGHATRAVNAIIPFWNAGIEGNDRMARAFKERPFVTTLRAVAAITVPSLILWWLNHDDDRYKELPQWQKDIAWIILTDNWEPYKVQGENGKLRDATDEDMGNRKNRTYFKKEGGKWMRNNGTIWRLPKPFTPGLLFGSVPERILETFVAKNPNAWKGFDKSLRQAFVPDYMPQAFLPIEEHRTNHSEFLDRPLVPKYMENIAPRYQSTPYTTETAKKIGALLSKVTDKSIASPIILENYVRQWTGTLGMSALNLVDQGIKAAGLAETRTQPEKTLADAPLVRAFVARFPNAGVQSIQDFYDEYAKRRKAAETVKYLSRAGETDALANLAQQPVVTAEKIHKALGQQQKFIRGVYLNKDMTAAEKRVLIDNTYLSMIEFARAGIDIFRQTEKRASP